MSRPLVPILVGIVILSAYGCGESIPSSNDDPRVLDGHAQMLSMLRLIDEQAADWHPYQGDAELRSYRSDLAGMLQDATDNDRIQLLVRGGSLELAQGEIENAIKTLTEACERLKATSEQISDQVAEDAYFGLAVAHLRRGESENCIHCQTGESCLLPIRGAGIHEQQSGSRGAIEYFRVVLQLNPEHRAARWLLNVACMTVGEYPQQVPEEFLIPPDVFESQHEFPRFANVATDLGLNTFSLCGGVIIDDFDGDGYLDIVTSTWHTSGQLCCFGNNRDGTFTDRTDAAGFKGMHGGLNLIQADYDNDGDLDILVLRGAWLNEAGCHPNSLLRNDGRGSFRDVTFLVGLGEEMFPTQTAAWADYDNDGDLDLYVGNEGYRCQLFQNDGGRFRDVAKSAGVTNGLIAKGAVWGDCNGDRFPDLYVSNLNGQNRLYRNNHDGTFSDVAQEAGVADPESSFPCWFWDFNNDGALDLFVSSYQIGMDYFVADYLHLPHDGQRDHLYQGDGRGGFRNVAEKAGVARVTLAMGSNFGDLDNDGFPDFYLGTGYPAYEGLMPNRMYHNLAGNGFVEVSEAGGFGHLQKGHGVAFSDLDNDGDQEVFIELGGAFPGDGFGNALFENPGFGNHWLNVRLIGTKSNRSAIGARVRAEFSESGTTRSVYQWVDSGGSFGAKPLRREIGLGQAAVVDLLEVFWPTTGKTQRFKNIAVDQFIEITEGESSIRRLNLKAAGFRRRPADTTPTNPVTSPRS